MPGDTGDSNHGDQQDNLIADTDISESTGNEMVQIISSTSFKTSDLISSISSTQLQDSELGPANMLELYAQFESKQKQLESLKQQITAVIQELSLMDRKLSENDSGKLGFADELSNTVHEATLYQEFLHMQKLICDNRQLRTKLLLSEKSRNDFRKNVTMKLEEELKRKIELEIENRNVKKKLKEMVKLNEDLQDKLDKYVNKSRQARSSLTDAITRIKSTISSYMDVETRRNSNFSLNESLLAYWDLI